MTAKGLTPQDGSHRPGPSPGLELHQRPWRETSTRGAVPCPPVNALSPRLTLCTGCTRTLIMYSMRLWECFSITDSIHIKGLTCRRGWRWHSHLVVLQSPVSQTETEVRGDGSFAQV